MNHIDVPFKYVGDERYIEIFETKQGKCSSCGLITPKEESLGRFLVTYCEITNDIPNKLKFFATLNGHKILDKIIEEPCRWILR
jgi:hypothetical protein